MDLEQPMTEEKPINQTVLVTAVSSSIGQLLELSACSEIALPLLVHTNLPEQAHKIAELIGLTDKLLRLAPSKSAQCMVLAVCGRRDHPHVGLNPSQFLQDPPTGHSG